MSAHVAGPASSSRQLPKLTLVRRTRPDRAVCASRSATIVRVTEPPQPQPTPEAAACTCLRRLLSGPSVGADLDSERPDLVEVLEFLERFVPWVLREGGQGEVALDGIELLVARNSGELELLLVGWGIPFDDSARQPLSIRLRLSPSADEIERLRCRHGAQEGGPSMRRLTLALLEGGDGVAWAREAVYG
jgi:hypothetical protein